MSRIDIETLEPLPITEALISFVNGTEGMRFTVSGGRLPPYMHLDEKTGKIYGYYLPQYYTWCKRKTGKTTDTTPISAGSG